MRVTRERAETAKRFVLRNFINEQKGLHIVFGMGAFIANPYTKYQKTQKQKLLQGTKREENQKGDKGSQRVKVA